MLFSRFALSAAALLLVTLGLAAPARAQNNKQIISGTWYEDRAMGSNSSSVLLMTFAQTPTNQFLNITNVSCAIQVSTGQVLTAMTLFAGTTSGMSDLGRLYAVKGSVTAETIGTSKYYSVITNQVYFKFGPGRYPTIEIDIPSTGALTGNANCVIVGNLTDS